MLKVISPDELISLSGTVYIDVRSESEFKQGTIPGALNIPIFDDEQRTEIGTIYKQKSPKEATLRGLEIAGKKLPLLYKQIEEASAGRQMAVFCWRGGMRSKSVASILDMIGLSVFRLDGGYKAYRNLIVDFFSQDFPYHLVVIRGNTGTGKTELLHRLKKDGYPVIDLEGLSNNRGSVFGHIGLGQQPTQKQFEALLFQEIMRYRDYPYLILECESKRIGRIVLPASIYKAMRKGTQVLLYDTLTKRIQRLVREYTVQHDISEDLQISLERLTKRLGKKPVEAMTSLLQSKDYVGLAEYLIIEYYDKLYGYPNEESSDFSYCITSEAGEAGLKDFKDYLDRNFGL